MSITHPIGGMLLLAVTATCAIGQQREGDRQNTQSSQELQQSQSLQQSQQNSRQGSSAQSGQTQQLDRYLAQWLRASNEAEIKLAQMGEQKSQNEQVKQFAQMLVQDHQQLSQKLQQLASQGPGAQSQPGQSQPGQSQSSQRSSQSQPGQSQSGQSQPGQSQPGQSQSGQSQSQLGQSQSGSMSSGTEAQKLVQIHEQIASKRVESLMKGLEEKQAGEFDQAFMGLQVLHHMAMLETLQVMQQQSGGKLRETLTQAEQSVQQHLDKASQLSQELSQTDTASRQNQTERR
jgi:predicted outer membrane protein